MVFKQPKLSYITENKLLAKEGSCSLWDFFHIARYF